MKAIDDYLAASNTTIAALADKVGMTRQTLSLKNKQKRELKLHEARKLAEVMGCSIYDLCEGINA